MITRSSVCLSVYLCVSVSVQESYGHDHQELCLCVCLSVSLCVSVSVQESYGRVTYHQELWLFPSLLLFHSDLARLLLSSRHRQIPAARSSALSLNRPGALLPYESGATGMSFVCPSVCHKTESALSCLMRVAPQVCQVSVCLSVTQHSALSCLMRVVPQVCHLSLHVSVTKQSRHCPAL